MANSCVRRVFGSEPFFISGSSSSSSSSFLGPSSMVSFEDVCGGGKRSGRPFFCTYDQEENGDDDYDEFLRQPEKKRRMTIEQVQLLEKSFETDIKLEPERKAQLAKELGLQPRQIAIWFQNRRARWKNKRIEKDFDALQASYNGLKSDYDCLLKEKEKLKNEVDNLTSKLLLKEREPCNQSKTVQRETVVESTTESEEHHVSVLGYNKQEDLSSAKSDVIDSDSPHYVNRGASYAFEADQSDVSQDDEDYLNRTLLPSSHVFTEINDVNPSENFDLSGDEHDHLLWPFWDINLKIPNSLNM